MQRTQVYASDHAGRAPYHSSSSVALADYPAFASHVPPPELFIPFSFHVLLDQVYSEASLSVRRVKMLDLVERVFEIRHIRRTRHFLAQHEALVELLLETYRRAEALFNQHLDGVCLKYDRDPTEDFDYLCVTIDSGLAPEQALALLDQLDEEWYLDLPFEQRRQLHIILGAA